jgi:hypothetical protein
MNGAGIFSCLPAADIPDDDCAVIAMIVTTLLHEVPAELRSDCLIAGLQFIKMSPCCDDIAWKNR